jgi:ATP-binding cassette subfamily C (CFTR/MRP) protein 1
MLDNVVRWPMESFDQTPVGRILNRFSRDIEAVDVLLPQSMRSLLQQLFAVIHLIRTTTLE